MTHSHDGDAPSARAPEPSSPRATESERLLSLLENAAVGTRLLDAEIWDALGLVDEAQCARWCKQGGRTDLTRDRYVAAWAPNYTTSLDAALMLRTEQYSGQLLLAAPGYDYGKYVAPAKAVLHSIYSSGGNYVEGYAKTLPLALCVAGIKARLP